MARPGRWVDVDSHRPPSGAAQPELDTRAELVMRAELVEAVDEWSINVRQVRTKPGSTYALTEPSGRAAVSIWKALIPARVSHGT